MPKWHESCIERQCYVASCDEEYYIIHAHYTCTIVHVQNVYLTLIRDASNWCTYTLMCLLAAERCGSCYSALICACNNCAKCSVFTKPREKENKNHVITIIFATFPVKLKCFSTPVKPVFCTRGSQHTAAGVGWGDSVAVLNAKRRWKLLLFIVKE